MVEFETREAQIKTKAKGKAKMTSLKQEPHVATSKKRRIKLVLSDEDTDEGGYDTFLQPPIQVYPSIHESI